MITALPSGDEQNPSPTTTKHAQLDGQAAAYRLRTIHLLRVCTSGRGPESAIAARRKADPFADRLHPEKLVAEKLVALPAGSWNGVAQPRLPALGHHIIPQKN